MSYPSSDMTLELIRALLSGEQAYPGGIRTANFQLTDTQANPINVDNGMLVVSDEVREEAHSGFLYTASIYSASVANNSFLDVAVTVGALKSHVDFAAFAGGNAVMLLYEAPTNIALGAAQTMYNHNRGTAGVAPVTLNLVTTVTTVGPTPLINGHFIPGGSGGNRVGGQARWSAEWMFKPNTVYLFRIQNVSGGAVGVSFELGVYAGN